MKLIPPLLLTGMLAVSGWAQDAKPEPYSAELERKAEAGDANAQCSLGNCYYKQGVTKDYKEAVNWYKKAVKWYTKAAEQGTADAQCRLGFCYDEGYGVAKDKIEAVKWYTKAAEQGDAIAQFNLGFLYKNGTGVAKDEKEGVRWYTKAAEQGDAMAQCVLGGCYYEGKGVTKDEKEAVKWYTKSAEQGNARAQFNLGFCYANGTGVAKDEIEGAKWNKKSAEQGDAGAALAVGSYEKAAISFVRDQNVNPSKRSKAFEYLWQRAIEGDAEAVIDVLDFFSFNRLMNVIGAKTIEVPDDDFTTERLIKSIITTHPKEAYYWYGELKSREGLNTNYFEALDYYKRSAFLGNTDCISNIVTLVEEGKGAVNTGTEELFWRYIMRATVSGIVNANISAPNNKRINELEDSMVFARKEIESIKKAATKAVQKIKGQHPEGVESKNEEQSGVSMGTGFLITQDKHILTAAHVIAKCKQVKVIRAGKPVAAVVLSVDVENDLALLQAKDLKDGFYLSFCREEAIQGLKVFTIGFPNPDLEGGDSKLTSGEVSSVQGLGGDRRVFRLNLQASPGNSGGPLLNTQNEIVGLLIRKLDPAKVFKETGDLSVGVSYATKNTLIQTFLFRNGLQPKISFSPKNENPAESIVLIVAE